jgi:hypothetical protein
VGGLFVTNLFVGFICDGFNENKGSTAADMQYGRFYRQVIAYKPAYPRFKHPRNFLSVACRRLLQWAPFRTFSVLCVTANVVFMLTDHADPGETFAFVMDVQNAVFFAELLFEVLLVTIG